MDLFTSRINNQLPRYVVRCWSLGNRCVLAGLEPMDHVYPSTNSPNPANSTGRMRQGKATCLMIIPAWQGQPWYPDLLEMLVDYLHVCQYPRQQLSFLSVRKKFVHCREFGRFQGTSPNNRTSRRSVPSSHGIMARKYSETVRGTMEIMVKLVYSTAESPFSVLVMDILTCLTEQFNSRILAYRNICVYKACILQLHDPIEGQQVGNLPLVSQAQILFDVVCWDTHVTFFQRVRSVISQQRIAGTAQRRWSSMPSVLMQWTLWWRPAKLGWNYPHIVINKYRLVASTEVTKLVIDRGSVGPEVNNQLSYRGQ